MYYDFVLNLDHLMKGVGIQRLGTLIEVQQCANFVLSFVSTFDFLWAEPYSDISHSLKIDGILSNTFQCFSETALRLAAAPNRALGRYGRVLETPGWRRDCPGQTVRRFALMRDTAERTTRPWPQRPLAANTPASVHTHGLSNQKITPWLKIVRPEYAYSL